MVTRGYLPLGYLLIFEMPCSNFATLTALCVISENESSVSLWFQHIHVYAQWYLQHFLLFIIRGSCSLKSSFVSWSFCVSQVTWFFPTLWSSWHGCPNCLATRSPKHTILAFSYCHLQVCLWHGEKQAMSFQDFATNGRHIVCQNLLVACQKFREHVRSVSEVPRRC
jgi:hypothetical protein